MADLDPDPSPGLDRPFTGELAGSPLLHRLPGFFRVLTNVRRDPFPHTSAGKKVRKISRVETGIGGSRLTPRLGIVTMR